MDVDLIGCVDVGLGGTYGCRCGILYAPMLGVVVYVELVSLTSLLVENCQNTENGRYRPKHVVFPC